MKDRMSDEQRYQEYLNNIAQYNNYENQVRLIKLEAQIEEDGDLYEAYQSFIQQMNIWQKDNKDLKILVTFEQAIAEIEIGGIYNPKCYYTNNNTYEKGGDTNEQK